MTDFDREAWRQQRKDQREAWREQRDAWRMERLERMRQNQGHGMGGVFFGAGSSGLVIGLILTLIGVLFLLQNLGILYVDNLWQYWPLLLILFGLSRAATAYGVSGRVWGGVLVFAGVIFQLSNLGIIRGDPWTFIWAILLIGLGAAMLAARLNGWHGPPQWWGQQGQPFTESSIKEGMIREVAIFGGGNKRIDAQDITGGQLEAVFGGIALDLRQAGLAKDKERVVIEANAVFGGVDIRVPDTWNVTVRGSGVFGGYADKTVHPAEAANQKPKLIIAGGAVFGGVTVRN